MSWSAPQSEDAAGAVAGQPSRGRGAAVQPAVRGRIGLEQELVALEIPMDHPATVKKGQPCRPRRVAALAGVGAAAAAPCAGWHWAPVATVTATVGRRWWWFDTPSANWAQRCRSASSRGDSNFSALVATAASGAGKLVCLAFTRKS